MTTPLASYVPVAELDTSVLFQQMFAHDELVRVFKDNFAKSNGKGVDRLNGFQFSLNAIGDLSIASAKCLVGIYRFTSFLEVLKTKGRDKSPRLIGIPTIRDRVLLHQLNKYLATIYPDRVPKNVASTYVRDIANDLKEKSLADTWVCGTDIQTFYDSIGRERLLRVLARRIKSKSALKMIEHALATPTVPKNTRRSRHKDYRVKIGVPQGLAISNILASIYMQDVDEAMLKMDVKYYRYVDDVLIYGELSSVEAAFKSLKFRLSRRGLRLHPVGSSKTHMQPLSVQFGYLGYIFQMPVISVRETTTERLLHSIAAKFSDYTHNKAKRLERFKYLTVERLKEIFLHELNERITGAISMKKRYGWIAYFNQITDLKLLHRLDRAIEGMFKRIPDFGGQSPEELKKLTRSYFEMKFNPEGGYVRNYDKITTRVQMLKLLTERGRVGPDEELTDEQITDRYEKYLRHILSAMHKDEGVIYG